MYWMDLQAVLTLETNNKNCNKFCKFCIVHVSVYINWQDAIYKNNASSNCKGVMFILGESCSVLAHVLALKPMSQLN